MYEANSKSIIPLIISTLDLYALPQTGFTLEIFHLFT